jgi:hypothetical protein
MVNHSKKLFINEAGDIEAAKDKSQRSTGSGKVAQVCSSLYKSSKQQLPVCPQQTVCTCILLPLLQDADAYMAVAPQKWSAIPSRLSSTFSHDWCVGIRNCNMARAPACSMPTGSAGPLLSPVWNSCTFVLHSDQAVSSSALLETQTVITLALAAGAVLVTHG